MSSPAVHLTGKFAAIHAENGALKSTNAEILGRMQIAESASAQSAGTIESLQEDAKRMSKELLDRGILLEAAYAENKKLRADLMRSREAYAEVEDAFDLKSQELEDARDKLKTQTRTSEKLAETLAARDQACSDLTFKLKQKTAECERLFKDLEAIRKSSVLKDTQIGVLTEQTANDAQKLVSLRACLEIEKAANRAPKVRTPIVTPRLNSGVLKSSTKPSPNPWD